MKKSKRNGARLILPALIILMAAIGLPALHSHSSDWLFLDGIRPRETEGEIQVLLHTTAPASYRVVSSSGLKIVVELPGARIRKMQTVPVHRGQVVQVRAAQHAVKPDFSVWVVVDLNRPSKYLIEKRPGNIIAIRIPLDPFAPEPTPLPAAGSSAEGEDEGPQAVNPLPRTKPSPVLPEGPPVSDLPAPPPFAEVAEIPSGFIMDLHSDSVLRMMEYGQDITPFSGNPTNGVWLKVTVPLLRQGGMGGQVFAVYVPKGQGFAWTVESIRLFYDMLAAYPDLAFAGSVPEVKRNLEAGKISALLGIEGGEAIESDIDRIDYLQKLGVRYFGLTWNRTNLIADAARDKNKPYGGLSPFGEQVIRRLNQTGVLVDLSHASHETIMDVVRLSSDPVMASHTNAHAVNPHWRNLTDEEIRAICSGGGVIGVSFYRTFLSSQRPVYSSSIVDHIVHIARVGGISCPALGSDFDGGISGPVDLKNIGEVQTLVAGLRARGFNQTQIDLICGKNFLRLLALMDAKHPAPTSDARPVLQSSIDPQRPDRE